MNNNDNNNGDMQQFVIERHIPGAGELTDNELAAIARKSCTVLDELGPSIRWIHSYVAEDRIYCIYSANNEDLIRRHAALGGFPANRVSIVSAIIDPSTASE